MLVLASVFQRPLHSVHIAAVRADPKELRRLKDPSPSNICGWPGDLVALRYGLHHAQQGLSPRPGKHPSREVRKVRLGRISCVSVLVIPSSRRSGMSMVCPPLNYHVYMQSEVLPPPGLQAFAGGRTGFAVGIGEAQALTLDPVTFPSAPKSLWSCQKWNLALFLRADHPLSIAWWRDGNGSPSSAASISSVRAGISPFLL